MNLCWRVIVSGGFCRVFICSKRVAWPGGRSAAAADLVTDRRRVMMKRGPTAAVQLTLFGCISVIIHQVIIHWTSQIDSETKTESVSHAYCTAVNGPLTLRASHSAASPIT